MCLTWGCMQAHPDLGARIPQIFASRSTVRGSCRRSPPETPRPAGGHLSTRSVDLIGLACRTSSGAATNLIAFSGAGAILRARRIRRVRLVPAGSQDQSPPVAPSTRIRAFEPSASTPQADGTSSADVRQNVVTVSRPSVRLELACTSDQRPHRAARQIDRPQIMRAGRRPQAGCIAAPGEGDLAPARRPNWDLRGRAGLPR